MSVYGRKQEVRCVIEGVVTIRALVTMVGWWGVFGGRVLVRFQPSLSRRTCESWQRRLDCGIFEAYCGTAFACCHRTPRKRCIDAGPDFKFF